MAIVLIRQSLNGHRNSQLRIMCYRPQADQSVRGLFRIVDTHPVMIKQRMAHFHVIDGAIGNDHAVQFVHVPPMNNRTSQV